MSFPDKVFYEFGKFRLQADNRVLMSDGEVVRLMPKTGEALLILVEQRGHVVGKEELLRRLWPDVIVEENNLSQHISTLRKALGQDNNGNKFIETVPKRGYRFVAEVREVTEIDAAFAARVVTLPAVVEESQVLETAYVEIPAAAEAERTTPNPRRWFWLAAVMALVIITAPGAMILLRQLRPRPAPSPGLNEIRSIAVLPFNSLPPQEDEAGLGIGIADNLINRLGGLSQLIVRPVRAVSKYDGAPHDPLAAGRELLVDAVLDGGVQRAEGRVRVTVRLLRVSDGGALWADKFDGQSADIFAVQDWIADRVTRALTLELTRPQRERLAKRYTGNADAWQSYARGRYFWNQRTVPALRKSVEQFERAVAIDPRYALAQSGLADSWLLLGVFSGVPPQEAAAKSKAAALRALELDEEIAEAHASLGVLKAWYVWDWAGAEQELRRALVLNPSYATAHQWHGLILASLGRNDEAVAALKRAQELDPSSLVINADLALVYVIAGQYEPALVIFDRTLELDADFNYARLERARVYVRQGRYEEALAEFEAMMARQGRTLDPLVDVGYTYALMGRTAEARRILEELRQQSLRTFVPPMILAALHGALGEKEPAFRLLEQEYAQHSDRMTNLNTLYLLAPLRDDPRFTDLLRRVGLSGR